MIMRVKSEFLLFISERYSSIRLRGRERSQRSLRMFDRIHRSILSQIILEAGSDTVEALRLAKEAGAKLQTTKVWAHCFDRALARNRYANPEQGPKAHFPFANADNARAACDR